MGSYFVRASVHGVRGRLLIYLQLGFNNFPAVCRVRYGFRKFGGAQAYTWDDAMVSDENNAEDQQSCGDDSRSVLNMLRVNFRKLTIVYRHARSLFEKTIWR